MKINNAHENFMYNLLLPMVILILPTVVLFYILSSSGFVNVQKDGYIIQFGGAAAFYTVALSIVYYRFNQFSKRFHDTIERNNVKRITIKGTIYLPGGNEPAKNVSVSFEGTNSLVHTNDFGYFIIEVMLSISEKYTIIAQTDAFMLRETIDIPANKSESQVAFTLKKKV